MNIVRVFILFFYIVVVCSVSCAVKAGESPFPDIPTVGDVKVGNGKSLVAAVSVAVKLTSPSLHLRPTQSVRLERLPLPSYPESMYNIGVTGKCEILFDLEEDGSVTNIRVGSSPNREFGETAIEAVKKWKLEPLNQTDGTKKIPIIATFIFSIYREDFP